MAKRRSMSKGQSRGNFRAGTGTHKKNVSTGPMRGGIRL
jgi:hypothetical protein